MDSEKFDRISRRAYELWEAGGRQHGEHEDHWRSAEQEFGAAEGGESVSPVDPHPGMMGDGTEEQNLGQPGNPDARITEDEVAAAFAKTPAKVDDAD